MNITYRMSEEKDKEIISKLIEERFGNRDRYKVLDNLKGRYLLAFDEDRLVGMTGLIDGGYYNGPEIDWTCVTKDYEHKGIITNLIAKVIEDVDSDIYCSCWKLYDRLQVNLHHSMKELGFEPVIYDRVRCNSKHSNCKDICVNYIEGCFCSEDLYLRKKVNKNEN